MNAKDAVERSERAFPGWAALSVARRKVFLRALQRRIAARQEELAAAVAADTGKPVTEVLFQEITAALEMIRFVAAVYPRWLKDRLIPYRRPGFWSKVHRRRYEPLGVLGIIGPANYPFSLPVMQAAAALICGNCVVIKPSERAPRTAGRLKSLFEEAAFPPGVVEVAEGDERTAEAVIVHPGVRKIIFTGSTETGRKVARLCGRSFKPCVLELGGVGAAVVDDDADLGLAAQAVAWSAFYSTGASCLGTKRVFVTRRVGRAFLDGLLQEIRVLSRGDPFDPEADIGQSSDPKTDERLRALVRDAMARGARAWAPEGELSREEVSQVRGPLVISQTTPEMAVLGDDEELRGLVLCVREVDSAKQAIREANASSYGLSASVWSRNRKKAEAIAGELQVGMVWINEVGLGLPPFPWGGTKNSGWGRLFAKESLSELTTIKVISRDRRRSAAPKFWWFPYSRAKYELTLAVNALAYGAGKTSAFLRLLKNIRHGRAAFSGGKKRGR